MEIQITVTDDNDNAPLFQRSDYEGVVKEGDQNFMRPLILQVCHGCVSLKAVQEKFN